jgi:hypothetical protein
MSSKDAVIDLIKTLPDDVTLEGILAFLQETCARTGAPAERPAEDPDWSAEELSDDDWRAVIAHSLEKELNDPREDLYTLEDGEPADGER